MTEELERLTSSKRPNSARGFIAELEVETDDHSDVVVGRVKEVLGIVLSNATQQSLESWKKLLPKWFVLACADEITHEEAVRRRNLPMEERERLAAHWTLSAWLYWFEPEQRFWEWWDVDCISEKSFTVQILVSEHPFPSGALEWLLRAAGATEVLVSE